MHAFTARPDITPSPLGDRMSRESEITAFITARLDEEERVAIATLSTSERVGLQRGQSAPRWVFGDDGTIRDEADKTLRVKFTWPHEADHITRHDPARALRQIAVMRKLLQAHVGYYGPGDDEHFPIPTLRILAAIWDDHEDYADAVKAWQGDA